jgi:hypothetical protein
MFGWITKKSPSAKKLTFGSKIGLETLEFRDCPAEMAPPLAMTAPSLTCNLSYLERRVIRVQGRVNDDNPANAIVQFTGAATGSVTVQNDGSFSVDLNATALGSVTAIAYDADKHPSNSALFTLSSAPPNIVGFTGVCGSGNIWTFTGRVIDESAPNLTVAFGGAAPLNNQSAQVDANGYFTLSVTLPADPVGNACVRTTDWWGLNSNEPTFPLV